MQRTHARRMPGTVRVWLLGGFRVSVGSRTIEDGQWRLRKAAALVKLLSLAPDHRIHREQVMDLLWPHFGKKAASNNLRQALHAARRALASDPSEGSVYLASENESLVLYPEEWMWVDVDAFEEAVATARRTRDPATYRVALELYAGDLLPEDRYEEWVEARRQELRRTFITLRLDLARLYEERGEYEAGIETLRSTLSEEPTNEEVHAGLMHLYGLSGRQQEALSQYKHLREALRGHLGTEIGPTTRALRNDIAAARYPPAQPAAASQEELVGAGKHNLPVPKTNLVGREREIVEVKRMLAMTRLLTLTGPGGTGKTRLALELARDLVGSYPDGVWLVELADLSEGELLAQEVASVLGLREQPGSPILETLVRPLREKKLLLVLDNCEHLVEVAVRLVETLVDSCPDLRLLATSREPLGVADEVVWQVPSLSVPDPGKSLAVEQLAGYESARLFVERARYHNPTFALTLGNAGAVAEICQRLDGIPLAIELAAARADMLSAEQIARRLGDSLKLLTRGDRAASPRQQTLRGTLDWSYDLLNERECKLFGRLSVFAGGWTLEAAEAVGAGSGIGDENVLDLLSQLVDKSLVMADTALEGAPRLRMLEPVRQYAHEKLEAGEEADKVRCHHAVWFLGLAEEAESELSGARQGDWMDRLEAEHDNLRAALSWSLDREEAELGLRLATALRWFWYARGYLSEGRRWLEEALSWSDTRVTRTRAWALNGTGWIALFQGGFEAAKTLLEKALAMFRRLEDREGIASTLANLGFVAILGQREDIPVPALLEEAKELRPGLGDPRTVAYLLLLEGVAAFVFEGNLSSARQLHEESLALLREVGDVQGVGGCLFNMGLIEIARTDYFRAAQRFREALSVAREADDRNIIQLAFFGLANVAARIGQPARAARLWGASEAVREDFDMKLSPGTRYAAGYEDNLSTARSKLGEVAFEETWAEGKTMVQQQAVEYALSEDTDSATIPMSEEAPVSEPIGKLTRREQEVADFVVRGLTNRQIASQLMLSEHTVATHVRNVLKKLGLYSRNQIAVWFGEQQPWP